MNKSEAGKLGQIAAREKLARTALEKNQEARVSYSLLKVVCPTCGQPIPYEKKGNTFCNHSCASKHSNHIREHKVQNTKCKACCEPTFGGRVYCTLCILQGKHKHTLQLSKMIADPARRRYLLRTREHKCAVCDKVEWMGQEIPLVMDHVDGNSGCNTEENLRLICCNCDAQTSTYKNKNKGKGRVSRRQRYKDGKSY